MHEYSKIALLLFHLGWVTVPAKGKRCLLEGWPAIGKYEQNEAAIKQMMMRTDQLGENVAHVFGRASPLIAIDIDICDEVESRRAAIAAWNILGGTPLVRVGKDPKVALFYRKGGAEYDQPRNKPVEVFATSGQMIWFGTHPETKRPYRWLRKSPLEISAKDVPVLDPDCLRRFLSQLPINKSDVGNQFSVSSNKSLTDEMKAERANATNPIHFMAIIEAQLGRMKSKREGNGTGTRTITIASVAYSLTKRGLSDEEILGLFEKHFDRWPKEKRSLMARTRIVMNSAKKRQNRTAQRRY